MKHRKHPEPATPDNKYQSFWGRWSRWCSLFPEVDDFSARPEHEILFFVAMVQSNDSFSVIKSFFYAKHFHNVAGLPDSTKTSTLSYIMDAAKKTCSRPKRKKHPVETVHIRKIHNPQREGHEPY